MPDSSRGDPPADSAAARSLAEAMSALKQATDSLSESRTPSHADGSAETEREQYYRNLEERGALKDVDEHTDLSSLPSAVTHVRYPDGRVERLGYS